MRKQSKLGKTLSDIRWMIPIPYKSYLGHKNPRKLANMLFRKHFNRDIDFENPTTYNEIINVLKVTADLSEWSKLADKHLVKDFIKEKGFGHTIIKSYGAWERVSDIDFDSLPNSFILKPNNGAGKVIVVKDKSELNIPKTKRKLWHWLHKSYGYSGAELHYSAITPMIIAEELLIPSEYDLSISKSIVDYKWFCFNGSVTYVEVISNRWNRPIHYHIYDKEWKEYPEHVRNDANVVTTPIPKPKCLDEMLEMCQRLSKGLPQVRIDLYEIDGKVYFGEMTFTTGGGYSHKKSREFDELLAKEYYANLPK